MRKKSLIAVLTAVMIAATAMPAGAILAAEKPAVSAGKAGDSSLAAAADNAAEEAADGAEAKEAAEDEETENSPEDAAAEISEAMEDQETEDGANAGEESENGAEAGDAAEEDADPELAGEAVSLESEEQGHSGDAAALAGIPSEENENAVAEVTAEAPEGHSSTRDVDNDDLFEQYAESLFYPGLDTQIAPEEQGLTGQTLAYCKAMANGAKIIADGGADTSWIKVPLSELIDGYVPGTIYTGADLGVDDYSYDFSERSFSNLDAARKALYAMLDYDFSKAVDAFWADYPYEGYFSNGAISDSLSGYTYGATSDGVGWIRFTNDYITIKIQTEVSYRQESAEGTDGYVYSVDTAKTGAAAKAVANASSIVSAAASRSDYGKLKYYLDTVCDLVDYNYAAMSHLSGGSVPDDYDHGAWSLVYVFDGDPLTKVVCEGYAEAYQYLCDITDFNDSSIAVYSVSGTMNGGTGAGGHKWNVVHFSDGNNYLIDATNCDEGTSGFPYDLFMVGAPTVTTDTGCLQYTVNGITYIYYTDTMKLFTLDQLTLAETSYEDSESKKAASIRLYSNSLSLGSTLGVKYFMILPEATAEDSDAYMQFEYDGEIKQIPATDALNYTTTVSGTKIPLYLFVCELPIAEMTTDIKASFVESDGSVTELRTYSVEKYIGNMMDKTSSTYKAYAGLFKAMLNYGACAQEYFGVNTDALANRRLGSEDASAFTSITADALADNTYETTGSADGLTYRGSSLLLEAATSIRHYFKVADGHSISEYKFSYSGGSLKPQQFSAGIYYVTIPSVTAGNLGTKYVVTVTDKKSASFTLSYSALSYARAVLMSSSPSSKLLNLMKALTVYTEELAKVQNT